MLITLNCDWAIPGEVVSEGAKHNLSGMNAVFGLCWQPSNPANDNVPEWLDVVD